MKNLIIAIREQQLIVEKLIAKYRQEGGDDLFFVMAELDVKNAKLSAAVAKCIADSKPKPKPGAHPFDPTLAPKGFYAKKHIGCYGCYFIGPACLSVETPCSHKERPDKTSVIFVKKETP